MFADDDRPVRKVVHEIGQDLSQLSVDDLAERIEVLKAEIARLDAARASKSAARSGADAFFKVS